MHEFIRLFFGPDKVVWVGLEKSNITKALHDNDGIILHLKKRSHWVAVVYTEGRLMFHDSLAEIPKVVASPGPFEDMVEAALTVCNTSTH